MRVLLVISNYKTAFPYINSLEKELRKRSVFVNVLDIENLYKVNNDGSFSQIVSGGFIRFLLRFPKIRTYVRLYALHSYLKTLRGKFDAVGIHSCDSIYIDLVSELQKVSQNLSVTIWGSDFYRANDNSRQKKRAVFDRCNLIVFGSPSNMEDFINYYKAYINKSVVCGFGISNFDAINDTLKRTDKNTIKSQLGLPIDKFIVAIGYNGIQEQQHEKLITELERLPQDHKDRLFLLIPMTYGGSQAYRKLVVKKANASGISYRIIQHYLDDQEVAKFRIASDILLNAQISDGFSASMQEHIYAKSIVVVGDWLRYKALDLSKIFYLKSSFGNFGPMIKDLIENFNEYQELAKQNPEKIYELSSWENKIPDWVAIYQGTVKRDLFETNL